METFRNPKIVDDALNGGGEELPADADDEGRRGCCAFSLLRMISALPRRSQAQPRELLGGERIGAGAGVGADPGGAGAGRWCTYPCDAWLCDVVAVAGKAEEEEEEGVFRVPKTKPWRGEDDDEDGMEQGKKSDGPPAYDGPLPTSKLFKRSRCHDAAASSLTVPMRSRSTDTVWKPPTEEEDDAGVVAEDDADADAEAGTTGTTYFVGWCAGRLVGGAREERRLPIEKNGVDVEVGVGVEPEAEAGEAEAEADAEGADADSDPATATAAISIDPPTTRGCTLLSRTLFESKIEMRAQLPLRTQDPG